MKTEQLIEEAVSLPVEERARLTESLLKSLNTTDADIDAAWLSVARTRLAELHSGQVQTVPGTQVFERIRERLGK